MIEPIGRLNPRLPPDPAVAQVSEHGRQLYKNESVVPWLRERIAKPAQTRRPDLLSLRLITN